MTDEYVADAYGRALVRIGGERKDLIVLDGDLAADCRVRAFENAYPERFIENGIAEQDMVSMAGGLARQGLLPVVNSFASFLATRSNEQIYNNASEGSKIIYALHFGGLIPSGPGKSHQSVRDIALMASVPNMVIVQPCNAREAELAVEFCVNRCETNCALRMNIGPSPRRIELPTDYRMEVGRGVRLVEGSDVLLISYGPVMLHETLLAAELLAGQGAQVRVVNMPWLNRVDGAWLLRELDGIRRVYVIEDHSPVGALGDHLLSVLAAQVTPVPVRLIKFGVEGYPVCGTPSQALRFHGLDGQSLAQRINEAAP